MPQECSNTPVIAIGHMKALKVSFSQIPSENAIKLAPNIEASDSLYFTFCMSFELCMLTPYCLYEANR